MNRLFVTVFAASLMTASFVAQAHDHDRHGKHSRHDDRHHGYSHDHRANDWDERRAYTAGYRAGRYDAGRYYRPTGYRAYVWRPGHRLPTAYYAPRYVVNDYDRYHLHRPPHGHHWVRVDHDIVLAAIATGAIVHVAHDFFH